MSDTESLLLERPRVGRDRGAAPAFQVRSRFRCLGVDVFWASSNGRTAGNRQVLANVGYQRRS